MEEIKVFKNVPIPKFRYKEGKWQCVLSKMNVGDSILVNSSNDRIAIRLCANRNGMAIRTIKEGMQFRVWRVR